MTACPNCAQPMRAHRFSAALPAAPVEVDACPTCHLFWFDRTESLALDRQAVRALFTVIADSARQDRRALDSSLSCPRCGKRLAFTHDLQRSTRFTYWRCAAGHGRLTGFHAFLREKNFLREPSAAELARLRELVRQVNCSQCGAPIDLARENACSHCRAPIALLDPDGVARTLRELDAAAPGSGPAAGGGDAAARAAMAQAMLDSLTASERERHREGRRGIDLLAVGAGALATVLGLWMR
ncbi:MAG: zf-TFIIB domain-containing protein [Betaproteobacteria bacterium]|nr:zf-TFIIB domain-containing protein [Betaproteobacteria bacterium]